MKSWGSLFLVTCAGALMFVLDMEALICSSVPGVG